MNGYNLTATIEGRFLLAVQESYAKYHEHGARSTEKLRPLHHWIADEVKTIIGQEYSVQSLRKHGMGGEKKIEGKYYEKNEYTIGTTFYSYYEKVGRGKHMIGKNKEYGIVYTPEWVVDCVLEQTINEYYAGMRVCDPACGDGAFLARVVERICDNLSAGDCEQALKNMVGFDIDADVLKQCRERLDATLLAKGKDFTIEWNLHCFDSTHRVSLLPHTGQFDYLVGNPPYVRIQHLGATRRARLQHDWLLAQRGSTDIYIAFFEIGVFLLRPGGRLGYITPNTYVKTAAGQALRKFILEQHGLLCMIDFGSQQVFKDATTYSLITVLHKDQYSEKFALYRHDNTQLVHKGMVPVSALPQQGIWILESEKILQKIANIRARGVPLGEMADIHVGIQTLADHVFILDKKGEKNDLIIAVDHDGNTIEIEKNITRPILKASVMKNGHDKKTRIIIFPYQHKQLITEPELRAQYPRTYQYLCRHKDTLLARDKGSFNPNRWYAFGREFGLTSTFGHKIITAGMNKQPNFQKCLSPEYTFYAGYCVKPKADVNIDKLLTILNSVEMDFYIRCISRDYQNGWKSYAKSFIQDYGIPKNVAGSYEKQMVLCE